MPEPHFFQGFRAGSGELAADACLPQHDLRVLQRDGIIIHHQHIQFLVIDVALQHAGVAVGFAQRDRHGEGRPFSLFAFHFDMAVHQLHDAFRDGHTKAGAAVFACGGGILLAERVEEVRQKLLAHADAGIPENELQHSLTAEALSLFDQKGDFSALRRELHRVAQNIDHHLAELDFVAVIIIVYLSHRAAVEFQPLVPALATDNGIDLLQRVREGKLFILDDHTPGLNPAHVQDVVDDSQQMLRRSSDFFQKLPGFWRNVRIVQGDAVQPNDGVHRRADLMTHIGKEGGLGLAGLLCRLQRFLQGLTLLQQLILQRQLFFHLLLSGAVFRVRCFLLERKHGVFPVLPDDKGKHYTQHQRDQR